MIAEDIYNRFHEVIPSTPLKELDVDEVYTQCKLAFEMIDYTPNHLESSFNKAWESSNAEDLPYFIYDVYVEDCYES